MLFFCEDDAIEESERERERVFFDFRALDDKKSERSSNVPA